MRDTWRWLAALALGLLLVVGGVRYSDGTAAALGGALVGTALAVLAVIRFGMRA
jgi:hypothetical protein